MDYPLPPERVCVVCGASMISHRRHARFCGRPCKTEGSRIRRILEGKGADGRLSLHDHFARARKGT